MKTLLLLLRGVFELQAAVPLPLWFAFLLLPCVRGRVRTVKQCWNAGPGHWGLLWGLGRADTHLRISRAVREERKLPLLLPLGRDGAAPACPRVTGRWSRALPGQEAALKDHALLAVSVTPQKPK